MAELPEKVGRYPIVGLLATGGMAEILLGKVFGPSGFERPVVIKRVLSHLARQQLFVDMFLDEARIVAGIHHPNVVHVQELGHDGDDLFLVMEYLDGESANVLLRRLRRLRKRLPYVLAAHIVAEACAGLHAAHELTDREGKQLGLVHRDLSPQNLFLTYSGQVKLIDFGVAHAADRVSRTEVGQVKGKFSYMSPEQGQAKPLDRRSDIFSLGIVLFELSTGRRLFYRPNELLTLRAICQDPLPRPSSIRRDYPPQLEGVVLKALSRDPANRFSSAAEMRRTLFHVMSNLEIDQNPSDALATIMGTVFRERMGEKAEMMRRVAAGTEVPEVPTAEVDIDVVLPNATDRALGDSMGGGTPSTTGASVVAGDGELEPLLHRGRGGKRRRVAAAVALGAAAIGTAGFVAMLSGGDGTESDANAVAAPTTPDTVAAAPSTTAEAERPLETVSIFVDSAPRGAKVTVAGKGHGKTPTEITLPRGAEAVEVVLERRGYERLVERVVPNVDTRLQLALKPQRRVPASAPTAKAGSTSSFRRFD
ncbi:MAG: serine/threonine protein kinase [Deltaproteobacteria bacterium]|nr:serine/threonine protein kinase [Deltaproteobacteria bacterium]MBW2532440.1 serine/threonine protein kinase [Deltaproteobacteria bacterium]